MGHLTDAAFRSESGRGIRGEPRAAIPAELRSAIHGGPVPTGGREEKPLHRSGAERSHRRNGRRRLEDVAHDLRDPIQTIRLAAAALASDGVDEGHRQRFVDAVLRSAEMVQDLVLDLLTGDGAADGGRPLDLERVDVDALLEETRDRLRLEARQREVTIDVESSPRETLCVPADRRLLNRILSNLIRNALAHSGGDNITLAVARTPDGMLRFEVRDTGRGIPSEERERILRFFGRPTEQVRASPGRGLGIVKRGVRLHGGRVWLESEPGKGTSFYFTLSAGADGRGLKPGG